MNRIISLVGVGAVVLLSLIAIPNFVEWVEATEYCRVQFPSGGYTWWTTPGPHGQYFGSVTCYKQRGTIEFKGDNRQTIVFNDAGKGYIAGSINYELPLDEMKLNEIHRYYPSQEQLEASLIKPALNKSVYLTGTLMSSYESYKERRTQLIQFVDDTVQNGVYQTDTRDVEVPDDIDPTKMKRTTVVVILRNAAGQPQRVDQGQLNRFGIRTFNFAIEDLDYDEQVDKQIQGQQAITMQVQTAIAEAKRAEQQKLTVEANGAANAAQAKWEQERIKAQRVTEAQQELEVATLNNQRAEQERQAIIKVAQGESEARRLKMAADGALEQKLKAYVDVNHGYAQAIQNYKGNWVPTVSTGGGNAAAGSGAQALIDMLTVKTAKDLGLDVTPGAKP